MIYLYDQAVAEDLEKSFNPDAVENPVVRVIDPESSINLAAQMHNDEVKYPVVALTRVQPISLEDARMNFRARHVGVQTVLDPETNIYYYERTLPIELAYEATVIATNQVDMDEIVKELLFKYVSMYFLTIDLPYECKRSIRFGIGINNDSQIETASSTHEYLSAGTIYQTSIPLKCEGAVLVSYRPVKLKRTKYELGAKVKTSKK